MVRQEAKQPDQFTVPHWLSYAQRLILDTGETWDVEDFQVTMFEPFLLPWRCKEIWTVIPEGNTKCLAVDTRLPTPDGWTTMLEVQPGDELLGSDGLPTIVRRASEVKFEESCFRMTFSDGASVVCNGDHLWSVEDAADHYKPQVQSTSFLYWRPLKLVKGQGTVARWRVPTASRRSSPAVDLPIDPYVLGVWLGDGASSGGRITNVDAGVWDEIRTAGYGIGEQAITTKAYTQTVLGLAVQLRAAGLLGNKHVPAQYLVAEESDRWRLLQGLMDTDGCVSKAGQATYSSTNKRLAEGVRQLVWSLGLPCSITEQRAVLRGTDYGPSYRLTISCDRRHPVARLARKQSRLKEHGLTCNHRRIVAIERISSVPVKCVEVDAPDRLYLAGEGYVPTHNTTSMAGFGLYHCHFTQAPWVPIVASSRDQAEILAQQAYGIIRATPGLEYNKKTHTGYFTIFEGYRQIKNMRNGGRGIKVYAADVGTSDGGIPTLVLCDEGHRWPDLGPYRLWKGKLGKRKGQIGMTSTAGDPGGDFEEQRDKIRDAAKTRMVNGSFGRYESPNICLTEWMVEDPAKVADMEAVKAANPFSGITVEVLLEEFESPTTDLGDWKRLKPLAIDTLLATPDGWTTMLEIEAGDRILNGDGLPTTVTAATPIKLADCYEITFSDGAKIVASSDHLWEVDDARNHHRCKIVSTQEMADATCMRDGRDQPYARWRVKLVGRKTTDREDDTPVDPYVLGVWLGDGSRETGHIRNGDPEVWAELERRGCELGRLAPSLVGKPEKRMQTLLGLRVMLRRLGVLNNKHIPAGYLVASETARWELLQGLMDADGTVLKDGRAIFWNTNSRLAGDVRWLVWSLGLACTLREERAVGVDHGPRYALEIPCDARHPVVRLSRKASRLRFKGKTCDHRRVRSVLPVGQEPVRCIAVDAEDSMFLAGAAMVPTHNCNIPARTIQAAITEVEWAKAYIKCLFAEEAHIDVGVDAAWKHDTFAITPLWRYEPPEEAEAEEEVEGDQHFEVISDTAFRLLGKPTILVPPRDGSTLRPDDVKIAFEVIMADFTIDTAVMDTTKAEDTASWLQDSCGIEVIDRSQTPMNAVADYEAFMKALRNGTLRHNGDPGLRKHVMNAVARRIPPGDKLRFDRPSQSRARRKQEVRVIDALTAAAMVNQYVDTLVEESSEPLVAWR